MKIQSLLITSTLAFATTACGTAGTGDAEETPVASEARLATDTDAPAVREILDVSTTACAATHPLAGRDLQLTTRSHGVRGTVRIVDDCTIVISGFSYDGAGRTVELYGSIGGSYASGRALSRDILRPSKPYVDAQLVVRLPTPLKVADLDGLSVWCSDVNVSFGDVAFR